MKKQYGIVLVALIVVVPGGFYIYSKLFSLDHIQEQKVSVNPSKNSINNVVIPFIHNEGQIDESIEFYANTFAGTIFVAQNGHITYGLANSVAISEELAGSSVENIIGQDISPAKINIFHGSDRSKWQHNLAAFSSLSLGEVYQGIKVELKAYGNTVEKLFYVSDNSDPGHIRVKVGGAENLYISTGGELIVETNSGNVEFSKPVAFQESDGKRELVEVAYAIDGNQYGFQVGDYDRSRELVIDPFLGGTYLGGSGSDAAEAVTTDSEGNIYVTGRAGTPLGTVDFPGISAASADSVQSMNEAYVVKLSNSLNTIIAATFLGGDGTESGKDVLLNDEGDVYVVGLTESNNFPGISSDTSADPSFDGVREAFVARLTPDLDDIISATYLGGGGSDEATSAVLDDSENLFVTGITNGSFPGVGPGSAQSGIGGEEDAFVAKLDSGLNNILASTYVGGDAGDGVSLITTKVDIALGINSDVYITGTTSTFFPDASFPGLDEFSADDEFEGLSEGFVARLNTDLTQLRDSTFLGGQGADGAFAVVVDSEGGVLVGGYTNSQDFPGITGDSLDSNLSPGDNEGFIVRLTQGLSDIVAATYLGGGGDFEFVRSLEYVNLNMLYATGRGGPGFPGIDSGSADNTATGGEAFVAVLNVILSTIDATFIGGSDLDIGNDLAFDTTGNRIIVAGLTRSSPFPAVGSSSADNLYGGIEESFVVKLGNLDNVFFGNMNDLLVEIDFCPDCPLGVLDLLSRLVNVAIINVLEGNLFGALSTMQNFIGETEAFIRSGEIPKDFGGNLISLAQEILDEISLTTNTVCSTLGDNRSRFFPDIDRFVFEGIMDETVTVTLDMDPAGIGTGDTATLFLVKYGQGFQFNIDRGPFPNVITTALNADGRHRVTVLERIFHPNKFEGDYCITIQSDGLAPPELVPTRSVE